MFATGHRGGCCGCNELKDIKPGDIRERLRQWGDNYYYTRKMQYHVYCSHAKREWMESELIDEGFVLLATNNSETVWGLVGKS